MGITVKRITVDEFFSHDGATSLISAYAEESSIEGMPQATGYADMYRHYESLGIMALFGCISGDDIVGFVSILTPVLPHYAAKVATTESIYVLPEYRKSGAGIKLIRLAEAYAREQGAVGLFISTPVTGRLVEILPKFSYKKVSNVFFRSLK